jgi:acyl-CoA synthetase (AMP-forming)/AMP-acid ligase II
LSGDIVNASDQENFIASSLRRAKPEQAAFIDDKGSTVSYGQLHEFFSAFRGALSRQNGHAVFVYLPHDVQKALCLSACLEASLPTVALSTRTLPLEAMRLALEFSAQAVITNSHFAKQLFRDSSATQVLEWNGYSFVIGFLEPAELSTSSSLEMSGAAWFLLTSGSTGASKAVAMSWENLRQRTEGELELLQIKNGDRILNCLSFAHDLGLNQLLCTLKAGLTLQVLPSAFPQDLLALLRNDKIETRGLTGTPMLWTDLLRLKETTLTPLDFDGYLTVSGGQLSVESLRRLQRLFPKARIIKTYGQTETFRTLAETRREKIATSSAGKQVKGVKAIVVDEMLRPCQLGEVGQMLHFGAGVMSSYYADPTATAEKLRALPSQDPLFSSARPAVLTGDYFRVLEDGAFEFVGRKDDLVKHLDHRIYLSEIQSAICELAEVSECFVLNVRDDNPRSSGQKLVAWVTVREGRLLTEAAVQIFCYQNMARYKVPDAFFVVENLPRTFSGKVDRQALLQVYGQTGFERIGAGS